jgi:DNA polymerase III subunit epsilon
VPFPDSKSTTWEFFTDDYIDVDESKLDDEISFLKTEIYLRDIEPRLQTLTAFDRFSVRA